MVEPTANLQHELTMPYLLVRQGYLLGGLLIDFIRTDLADFESRIR